MFEFYQEDIQEPGEYLHPFPQAEDIFVAEQPWLKEHFLPLVSIDLAVLNPDWAGQTVHMLNPFEPSEGYIGDGTEPYHNEFTAPNWLAFRLTDDNRYQFLGNEGFFMRSPVNRNNPQNYYNEEYADELRAHYQTSKQNVEQYGCLLDAHYPEYQGSFNRKNFLDDIGGGFWYGNWTEGADIPSAFALNLQPAGTKLADLDDLPDDGIKITYNGNPFHYIANVAGYNYCGGGADAIILMYEPVSRTVLFTFDYS